MRYCSRCGGRTSDENCQQCNGTDDPVVRTDGGQGPNDRGPNDGGNQPPGNQQPPQGGGQGQPQGGGQGQPPRGQQGGQQPRGQQPQGQQRRGNQQRGPPPQQDDGFSRRQLLIGGGGAAAVLGGGWFFFLRDDSSAGDSPEGTAEAVYSALDSGNIDKMNSLLHEESPEGEYSESDLALPGGGSLADADVTVKSTEVVDQDIGYDAADYDTVQEFKAVEVEYTISLQGQGGPDTQIVIVAQNSNGEWKLWE
jgi:hypothetical protein